MPLCLAIQILLAGALASVTEAAHFGSPPGRGWLRKSTWLHELISDNIPNTNKIDLDFAYISVLHRSDRTGCSSMPAHVPLAMD